VVDPFEIGKCDKLMSVNVTLMADLTGQACSESIGFFQYSSTGGQSDFARGVSLSNGGKGFCCLPSTVKTKDGKVQSTISAALPPGAVGLVVILPGQTPFSRPRRLHLPGAVFNSADQGADLLKHR
jgi:hypothetical protein